MLYKKEHASPSWAYKEEELNSRVSRVLAIANHDIVTKIGRSFLPFYTPLPHLNNPTVSLSLCTGKGCVSTRFPCD